MRVVKGDRCIQCGVFTREGYLLCDRCIVGTNDPMALAAQLIKVRTRKAVDA